MLAMQLNDGKRFSMDNNTALQNADKFQEMFFLMNQWVLNLQDGKRVPDFFEERNIHKIAIYGMSYVGEALLKELSNSSIEVVVTCDSKTKEKLTGYDGQIDAIIVTSLYYYDEIRTQLESIVNYKILSIGDVIYKMM